MKRFATFIEWLNHSHRSPESESPVIAAGAVSFLSFALVYWLDGRVLSGLEPWWVETFVYAFIPVVLAFIILYRSSWHQEMTRAVRAVFMGLLSCLIFPGAIIVAGIAFFLAIMAYYCFFNLARFHY